MQQEGTVVVTDAGTGRFGLHVPDAGYVLAEQLDNQLLIVGGSLSGSMDTMGTETLTDASTGMKYAVFILAYGLSLEAVEQELR